MDKQVKLSLAKTTERTPASQSSLALSGDPQRMLRCGFFLESPLCNSWKSGIPTCMTVKTKRSLNSLVEKKLKISLNNK